MQFQSIKSIKSLGVQNTLDFEVDHPDHNFYAEGIVVSNSHSIATSYLTALTVWAKYKYPLYWYWACLKSIRSGSAKHSPQEAISAILQEIKYFNIELKPPHLLESDIDFTIKDNNIIFGLSHIKGLGEKTIEKLIQFKKPHPNKFEAFLSAKQAGLSIGHLSAIIKSGCLDNLAQKSRSKLVLEAQLWNLLLDKEKVAAMKLSEQFNYDLIAIVKKLRETPNDKGKMIVPDKRYSTIKKRFLNYQEIYKMNSQYEDFSNYFFEYELLGFSYSTTLKKIFERACPNLRTLEEIKSLEEKDRCSCVARVDFVKEGVARNEKKTKYVRIDLSDDVAKFAALLFNDKIDECKAANGGKLPVESDIVWVKGQKFPSGIYAQSIVKQNHKIYCRLADLKDPVENIPEK